MIVHRSDNRNHRILPHHFNRMQEGTSGVYLRLNQQSGYSFDRTSIHLSIASRESDVFGEKYKFDTVDDPNKKSILAYQTFERQGTFCRLNPEIIDSTSR